MLTSPELLRETHLIGPRCREWVMDRERFPQLRAARFVWVGHSVLRSPYRMVRLSSNYSHIVAARSGRGRTLIDGTAIDWLPGHVLLAPAGACHAFEIAGSEPWEIAWVFFDDQNGSPVIPSQRTQLVQADADDFALTLQMLTREAMGAAHPAALQALVNLLDTHARRLIGADQVDTRLWRLWTQVEADLGHGWNSRKLAQLALMSEEHLRRLCHRHYQRSPMNYLTQLRMHRAGMLLRSTPNKIEEIAHRVGFSTVYAFSAAFKRWSSVPPSQFRLQTKTL
jgi:AraC-like DNA-binding protein